jgi:hypothetical protein
MIGSGGAILKCAHGDVLPTVVAAAASAKPRRDGVSVDVVETTTLRVRLRTVEAVVVKTPLLAVRRRRAWVAGRRMVMVVSMSRLVRGDY